MKLQTDFSLHWTAAPFPPCCILVLWQNEPQQLHSGLSLTLYGYGNSLPVIGCHGGSCHCHQCLAGHRCHWHGLGIHVLHRHRVHHRLLGDTYGSSRFGGVVIVHKQPPPCGVGCGGAVSVVQGGGRGGEACGLKEHTRIYNSCCRIPFYTNSWKNLMRTKIRHARLFRKC